MCVCIYVCVCVCVQVWRRFSEFVLLKKRLVALQQQHQHSPQHTSPQQPYYSPRGAQTAGGAPPRARDRGRSTSVGVLDGIFPSEMAGGVAGGVAGGTRPLVVHECWDGVSQGRGILGRAKLQDSVIQSRQVLLSQCLTVLLADNPPPRAPDLHALLARFFAAPAVAATTSPRAAWPRSLQGSMHEDDRLSMGMGMHNTAPSQADTLCMSNSQSSGSLTHALGSPTSSQRHTSNAVPAVDSNVPQPQSQPAAAAVAAAAQALGTVQSGQGVGTAGSVPLRTSSSGGELSMTVRLIVEPRAEVSDAELMRRQGGECAGCRAPLAQGAPAAPARSWLLGRTRSGSSGEASAGRK